MSLEFIERVFAAIDAGRKALWTSEPQMLLRTAAAQEELSPEEMAAFERETALGPLLQPSQAQLLGHLLRPVL